MQATLDNLKREHVFIEQPTPSSASHPPVNSLSVFLSVGLTASGAAVWHSIPCSTFQSMLRWRRSHSERKRQEQEPEV